MSRSQDILGVIRGLQAVSKAGIKLQEDNLKLILKNSTVKNSVEELANAVKQGPQNVLQNVADLNKVAKEGTERVVTVIQSAKQYFDLYSPTYGKVQDHLTGSNRFKVKNDNIDLQVKTVEHFRKELRSDPSPSSTVEYKIVLTPSDKKLLQKLDREHRKKLQEQAKLKEKKLSNWKMPKDHEEAAKERSEDNGSSSKVKAKPNPKSKQALSSSAKQRTVPSSRIGRMLSFGSLAAGLGLGTAAEFTKRTLGMSENNDPATLFLTESNMNRIVDTLCKVRGAALKIGQMLSIQDESVISPQLAKALERVRQSADFMPNRQVEQVLRSELGDNWQHKLSEFEEKPFAAASIGQVHWARSLDGREVAMKIQYPGVAKSIESDIDNLVGIMKVWNIFPKGMFIDNIVTVAKRELAWEVDYIREAECTKKFKELLKRYPDFYVPDIIDELCGNKLEKSVIVFLQI
ncbi:atypical kinase COQ8A, mitochondrial [Agrilus planipennis]|uniref:Atypical kinase COQ8A, mitochondrial n=1 Tax=Agrilus planipennis TaxID=224129 RepID=A0A7F5RJA4_AGRPL|nr:atypical kinase COQ8A, mitochondrial [Agrilus planipennis]